MLGFIVEGFNDEYKLRSCFPDAYVVVTQGDRLDNAVRNKIKTALIECSMVILLTDPDEAGNNYAKKLSVEFPTLQRLELDPAKCKCVRNRKLKIGVEHASREYLVRVINSFLETRT